MAGRRVVKGKLLGAFAILFFPVASFGAAMSAEGLAGPPGTEDALHEVVPGDDLHFIAGYYYGDARQWGRIWQANRWQVANPNRIERGMLLRIPEIMAPAEPYANFVARARRSPPRVSAVTVGIEQRRVKR